MIISWEGFAVDFQKYLNADIRCQVFGDITEM